MKTVTVTVHIQMDVNGTDILKEVQETLDVMNNIVRQSELNAQPQIFVSDINNSDIEQGAELNQE